MTVCKEVGGGGEAGRVNKEGVETMGVKLLRVGVDAELEDVATTDLRNFGVDHVPTFCTIELDLDGEGGRADPGELPSVCIVLSSGSGAE